MAMYIILPAYISLVIILHLIPVSGLGLSSVEAGGLRLDYFLHSLIFLPWMFLLSIRRVEQTESQCRLPSGLELLSRYRLRISHIQPGFFLIWMSIGLAMALGAETIHYLLPYRGFNPWDAVFNALGVMFGAMLLAGFYIIKYRDLRFSN